MIRSPDYAVPIITHEVNVNGTFRSSIVLGRSCSLSGCSVIVPFGCFFLPSKGIHPSESDSFLDPTCVPVSFSKFYPLLKWIVAEIWVRAGPRLLQLQLLARWCRTGAVFKSIDRHTFPISSVLADPFHKWRTKPTKAQSAVKTDATTSVWEPIVCRWYEVTSGPKQSGITDQMAMFHSENSTESCLMFLLDADNSQKLWLAHLPVWNNRVQINGVQLLCF